MKNKTDDLHVTIGEDGHFCAVEPACPRLSAIFYTLRHRPEVDAAGRCRCVRRPFPLVLQRQGAAGQSQSVCYAGLEPIVRETLRQLGYRVHRLPARCQLLPPPSRLPWELAETADESFLSLVQQYNRGLVRFDSQRVDAARLVAQAALAWRNYGIVVPVTLIADAWRFRAELAQYIPAGQIGVYSGGSMPDDRKRIAIGTYGQLGVGAVALHERHLLFALNPCELLANDFGRQVIDAARSASFYGLLPTSSRVTPYQRDLLWALFGNRSVSIPAHGKVSRPVTVFFTQVYGGQKIGNGLALPDLKRQGVWEHQVRNRRITALARAVDGKDLRDIAARFPDIVSGVRQLSKARIGVLTENVDHALELGRRLPNWPILTGESLALDELTPADQSRLQQCRSTSRRSTGIIVTMAGLTRAGRLDYVIRADGGVGIPDLDRRVTIDANGRPHCMTIIDFDDLHHDELRRRSQQRRRDYLDAGWRLPQQQTTELESFLRSRPKVEWR